MWEPFFHVRFVESADEQEDQSTPEWRRGREPGHLTNVKGLQLGLLLLLTTSTTMTRSKKWTLPSLTPISHQLIDHYKRAAIAVAGNVAGAVAVPAVMAIAGFAPAGIAAGEYLNHSSPYPLLMTIFAGSIAAGIHGGIGASTIR